MLWLFRFFGMNHQALFGGGSPDPHPNSDLLMESGSFFLLEDGSSTILLEV